MRSVILVDTCLLCECASTILCDRGKHTVTHAEPFDVAANGNNFNRKLAPSTNGSFSVGLGEAFSSEVEIYRVQTRSPYYDENIAWPRRRCRDFRQPRAFRAAVMLENVCAHQSYMLRVRGYHHSPPGLNRPNPNVTRA